MKAESRAFAEHTLADARQVVSDMFSPEACPILDKMLANPLRKELGERVAGEIAYQDGCPMAFQGAVLRRLYLGHEPIIGIVGSTLCSRPETSPVLLMQLMKATIKPRGGGVLFFANTANVASMKMNRMLGVKGGGPVTCERIRFAVTWAPRFLRWACPKCKAKIYQGINQSEFDSFWRRYLAGNVGLVASRSAEELNWMFGEGIASGDTILLGHSDEEGLDGYIVLRSTHGGKRWMVMDWIAVRDDEKVLAYLMKSAVRFIRRETSAVFLEMVGFPEAADRIAAMSMAFVRRATNNSYLWQFVSGREDVPQGSWFYGPYDGDRAMG